MLSSANEGPKAGDLRHRVDIIMPNVDADDGYDSGSPTTVLANVAANVSDLAGFDIIRAQMIADKATHVVTVRYNAAIQSKMRVISEGKTFYIQSVTDPNKPTHGVWMNLLCYEIEAK